jgi:two-component system sensor histidine kinase HydH
MSEDFPKINKNMTEEHLFDELKRYIGFDKMDEANLKQMGPKIQPHIHRVIDDFYDHILNHPGARQSITGGIPQVERLKGSLRTWMEDLFIGPWDQQYYEKRARIGRRHVQINLPQQYMFTAIEVISGHIHDILLQNQNIDIQRAEQHAIDKLLNMELAIMLHTYREDYLAKAQRNERLATFGQLTASVAHELRNPLGVIESSLFLLRRRVGTEPGVVSHLDKIESQLKISNRIITNMLDIVRDRPASLQKITPRELVTSAKGLLPEKGRERVIVEVGDDLPKIKVDPDQARQILHNLFLNGLEATNTGGIVQLTAQVEGPFVLFLVNDNGTGIDPSIRNVLFEPLVTTKLRGIGLGLALSRKLAERNQGNITLTSGPLPGAAFALRLPISEG